MGNEQSTDWGKQYSLLRTITQNHSRVALITQPQIQFSRLSLFLEPEEKSILITRLHKRKQQRSSFLQQVVKVFQKEGGICGNLQQVDIIWSLSSPSLLDHCRFRRLKRMPFREEEVLEVIRSIGKALEYLHNIGEAHGNINLASIIIQGSIFLKDPIFSSKEQDEDSHPKRTAPTFPSPQKLRECYDVVLNSGAFYSDLFSLGVVALQMCYLQKDIKREIYRARQAAYLNWGIDFSRIQQLLGSLPTLTLRHSIQVLLSPEEIERGKILSLNSQVQTNSKALKLLARNPFSIAPEEELFSEIEPYCQANFQKALISSGGLNNLNGSNITLSEQEKKSWRKRTDKWSSVIIDKFPVGGRNERPQSEFLVPIYHPPQGIKFASSPQEFLSHTASVQVYLSRNTNFSLVETQINQDYQSLSGRKFMESQSANPSKEIYNFSALRGTIRRLSNDLRNLIEISEKEKSQRQSTLFAAESLPLQKLDTILKWKTAGMIQEDSAEQSSCSETQFVVEEYEIGTRYEGYKKDGKRNGKGKFYYNQGSVYVGEWKDNKMHGFGALTYSNGCTAYEGEWEDDEFHGRGTLYNQDPTILEGLFDYTDFNRSEGPWLTYEGELRRGKRQGFGKLTLVNGECLEGQFKRNKVDGSGVFYCLNGQKVEGVWRQNLLTY